MEELVPLLQTVGPTGTFVLVLAWIVRDVVRSRNGSAPTARMLQETVVKELKEVNANLQTLTKRQEDIWDEILRRRD